MGLFNWKKKNKVSLTKAEEERLQQDQQLLSAVAALNADTNNSGESPFASLPGVRRVPPLIYACAIGEMFMVKDAINNGSDVNETDEDGVTPVHTAANGGYLDIVALLIDQGADKSRRDNNGNLPIDLAKNKGHQSVVDFLA